MESFCPIHLDLKDRTCLVIGGGKVAGRKVKTLLPYRARVTVLSPELSPELSLILKKGKISYLADTYRPVYLKERFLVICATGNPGINRRAARDCIERGIPVNTVSDPALCTFFFPALYKNGPLTLTVSTAGKSPALARRLRSRLGKNMDDTYTEFADFLGEIRPIVLEKVKDPDKRRAILEHLAGEEFFSEFKRLNAEEAGRKVKKLFEEGG